jgi:hypothetical protein
MITFTEAIELQDEAPSVDLQKLQAYLETVSPELAAAVRKDFTAADVHVGTALGNERGRKKPKKLSTVGDGKHQDSADVVSQRDDSWSMTFKILKADADKQHIYGWASVVEENGQLIVDKTTSSCRLICSMRLSTSCWISARWAICTKISASGAPSCHS